MRLDLRRWVSLIFYERNFLESVFIEVSWSDIDGEVFHDDDIDSWVVYVPGVGYAVEAEGTQNHFPEHVSLWMFYDTDRYKTDTNFTSANKTDVLLQIRCERNRNLCPVWPTAESILLLLDVQEPSG